MISRRKKKIVKAILDGLKEPAELNKNPGRLISNNRYISKKDKRNSGRYYPRVLGGPYKEVFENALEEEWYDDWSDWKDGQRDIYSDGTRLKKIVWSSEQVEKANRDNKKIKKQIKIRMARRSTQRKRKHLYNSSDMLEYGN